MLVLPMFFRLDVRSVCVLCGIYFTWGGKKINVANQERKRKKEKSAYLHTSHKDPLDDDMTAVSVLLSKTF